MYALTRPRERRLLWLLALTQFTVIMDFMVMMPLGPQIMKAFAITPSAFATAVSAYSWCSGISGLLAATYIDRFDRRKLLLVVYALFAVSNLACAVAGSFPLLLAARAFAGLSGGIMGSVVMAIVSDVIPPERRGAATGTLMMAFSLASIAGVPAGIVLGAHLGWATPFFLLVALSILFWAGSCMIVPSLTAHLARQAPPLATVLPNLWRLLTNPLYLNAFILTMLVMGSHMMVIPFVSPMLVANHGVPPGQLFWLYMAGGAATFFTSPLIGKLADRFDRRLVFRVFAGLSCLPLLFLTHMPMIPFIAIVCFFPFFMTGMSGRMIPMQALLTTVPEPKERGAFLSANSALQSLATGCGAWFGGLLLSTGPHEVIVGYGLNGWLAAGVTLIAMIWICQVRVNTAREPKIVIPDAAPAEDAVPEVLAVPDEA